MSKFQLNIDDELIRQIEKVAGNKSEFIRQAIVEKLDMSNDIKYRNDLKILSKLDNVEDRIMDLERINFLLNQSLGKQDNLTFKLFEEIYKLNVMTLELHDPDKRNKYKEDLQNYAESKSQALREKIT